MSRQKSHRPPKPPVPPESPEPPGLALRLLRRVCPSRTLDEVEGDLQESFARWVSTRGTAFARRRYWREVTLLAKWRIVRGLKRRRIKVPEPDRNAPKHPLGSKGSPFSDLLQDVRFGFRRLFKNPLSTTVAVLLLAIGIGGNATVFTVVDKTLMEPPPLVQNPKELVGLGWTMDGAPGVDFGYYDYEFYRDQGDFFSDVLAYGGFSGSQGRRTDGGGGEVAVGTEGSVDQAGAWVVSGNYFSVLGVPMGLGAGFSPEVEAGESDAPEVILSHGYWARSFGMDPSVLDRPIYLNGSAFRVAGITPREFRGVNPGEPVPDLFVPILSGDALSLGYHEQLQRYSDDGSPSASQFLRLIARLEPGADMAAGQAGAAVLQGRWEDEFSSWAQAVYGGIHRLQLRSEFNMAPFEAQLLKRQLYFLWFVIGAVFLIGCTNLAILLLASASGREREMGIRASLGAGRTRLLSQLITESLLLSALGGLVGLGVAYLAPGAITATLSMNLEGTLTPDGSVVVFALLLSTLAAVLFGTAPSWALSRVKVTTLLQRSGHGRTKARFRGGLVVVQTALSILLLIGGGLLARSVQAIQRIDLGFEPEDRLVMGLQLDNNGYSETQGQAFVLDALDRLTQLPGVRSATVCNRLPFLGSNTWNFTAPGTAFNENGFQSAFNLAGPDYFETMGIPILAGRGFSRDDREGAPVVAVVNEVFASQVWPGESPLGKVLDFMDQEVRVVGLAKTAVYHNVTEAPRAHAYLPSLQLYQGRQNFILHTEPPAPSMVSPVDRALRTLDANLGIAPMTLAGLVDRQVAGFRIWAALIGVFAGIALFLALVGLYGVQSYLVSRRTKEIGLRIALGAETATVIGGVVKSGLLMGGMGVVLGTGAAFGLVRFIRGALFGVAPTDPLVFTVVPTLLLLACLLATLVPALRASHVSPVEALSEE